MSETALRTVGLVLAAAAALLAVVASISVGVRTIDPATILAAFTDFAGTDDHIVIRNVRLPRTILALAVGAALAVSGALVQTLTRNPLAEPGILGVTSGASFAMLVVTGLWQVDSQVVLMLAAAVGALVATLIVYVVGGHSPLRLVLAGVALSAVIAGLGLAIRLANTEAFDSYRFWSVGSLAGREQAPLAIPLTVIGACLIGAALLVPSLDAVALGDDVAQTQGTVVARTRVLTLLVLTVLAAAATAVAGPIVFVGLIVPHLFRRLSGGSTGWLLAYCVVGGPVLILCADVLARLALPTGELPVAVVTAFLGGPVLIWVVRHYGVVDL